MCDGAPEPGAGEIAFEFYRIWVNAGGRSAINKCSAFFIFAIVVMHGTDDNVPITVAVYIARGRHRSPEASLGLVSFEYRGRDLI
ncbi:hypothetical protein D3C87_1544070 [compost metagenome]